MHELSCHLDASDLLRCEWIYTTDPLGAKHLLVPNFEFEQS